MSLADTLKAKKNIIILVVAAIVLAAVVVTQLLPSGEEKPIGPPPLVAKKAKITPPDETAKAVPTAALPVPVAPAPAEKKLPVKEAKSPAAEEKKPAIRVEAPEKAATAKTAEPEKVRPAVAKKGAKRWAVHVASLTYENEARHFASKLKKAGYNAYVTEFTKDGVVWYRVRAGFYSSRKEAQGAAKKIESKLKVKTSSWIVLAPKNEVSKHAR